jgi:osmotically inducible protein OsmC
MATVERNARIVWEGDLASGSGNVSGGSGAINEMPVTFASRVQNPDGKTSPEEMIASAHATCYAMAFSNVLNEKGSAPDRLTVDASCYFDDAQLKITAIDLEVQGQVSGMDQSGFESAANEAEQLCPVSNALRGNVEIRVNATLS